MASVPCAPLAELFITAKHYDEPHTRRNMIRLCEGCPVLTGCLAQAHREDLVRSRRREYITVGFRAGTTPFQRAMARLALRRTA